MRWRTDEMAMADANAELRQLDGCLELIPGCDELNLTPHGLRKYVQDWV